MNQAIINFLKDRSSIREFDPRYEVSKETIKDILNLAANSPSGNNSQPWRVVVVQNKSIQKKLKEVSFNQLQVETASGIFLIFGDTADYDVDFLTQYNLQNNIIKPENEEAFRHKMESLYALSPVECGNEALKLDCGLFAMDLLFSIKAYDLEAVPMRGTDFSKIKNLLEITSNWEPVLMIPFGKGVSQGKKKIRKNYKNFTTFI